MEKQIWLGYPTTEPHRYKLKIKFCLSLSVLMTEDAEDLKRIFINVYWATKMLYIGLAFQKSL